MALPTMFAAISVMGSQTSQGCNLTPRQRSELGQFCDESSSNDFANARNALQQVVLVTPERTATNSLAEITLNLVDLVLEPFDMGRDAWLDLCGCSRQAILFGYDHVDELSSARNKSRELKSLGFWNRPGLWVEGLREVREDSGIDVVGLSQSADGLGEIPNLPWIDDGGWNLRQSQSDDERKLISASSLQNHQCRTNRTQALDQRDNPSIVVGNFRPLPGGPPIHVQPSLRHINANKISHDSPRSCTPLRSNLADASSNKMAQATVRTREQKATRRSSSPTVSRTKAPRPAVSIRHRANHTRLPARQDPRNRLSRRGRGLGQRAPSPDPDRGSDPKRGRCDGHAPG